MKKFIKLSILCGLTFSSVQLNQQIEQPVANGNNAARIICDVFGNCHNPDPDPDADNTPDYIKRAVPIKGNETIRAGKDSVSHFFVESFKYEVTVEQYISFEIHYDQETSISSENTTITVYSDDQRNEPVTDIKGTYLELRLKPNVYYFNCSTRWVGTPALFTLEVLKKTETVETFACIKNNSCNITGIDQSKDYIFNFSVSQQDKTKFNKTHLSSTYAILDYYGDTSQRDHYSAFGFSSDYYPNLQTMKFTMRYAYMNYDGIVYEENKTFAYSNNKSLFQILDNGVIFKLERKNLPINHLPEPIMDLESLYCEYQFDVDLEKRAGVPAEDNVNYFWADYRLLKFSINWSVSLNVGVGISSAGPTGSFGLSFTPSITEKPDHTRIIYSSVYYRD